MHWLDGFERIETMTSPKILHPGDLAQILSKCVFVPWNIKLVDTKVGYKVEWRGQHNPIGERDKCVFIVSVLSMLTSKIMFVISPNGIGWDWQSTFKEIL